MNKITPFRIAIIVLLGGILFLLSALWADRESFFPETNGEWEKTKQYTGISLRGATSITCTYPQLVNANYQGGVISHELPALEETPFIFTFTKTDEGIGSLSWLDSTGSISNSPIIEIFAGEGRVTYMEGNGNAYVAIHTIFIDKGVSTYTKSVDLFGTPFATAAVGTCKPF